MTKFILLILLFCAHALGQVQITEGKVFPGLVIKGKNYVKNPSAFKNTLNVTTSSAAIARDTSTGNKIDGIASFTCDTSANGGYCEWALDTINDQDTTGSCVAAADLKGDATLYNLQLVDGSGNLLASSATLTVYSNWQTVLIPYQCGSARKIRLTQVTAGTSPAVNAGNVTWGKSALSQVSQAQWIGSINFSCASFWSAGGTSWTNFGSNQSTCSSVTASGSITASGTSATAVLANAKAGTYLVKFNSGFRKAGAFAGYVGFRVSDGTNFGAATFVGDSVTAQEVESVGSVEGRFTYTTPQSSITWNLQGIADGASNVARVGQTSYASGSAIPAGNTSQMQADVYYFPSQTQAAVTPEMAAWKVDANIGGGNIGLGTASISSYSEMGTSSLVLTQNTGSISTGIACASGTTSVVGNTTCASTRSNGITFNLPVAGDVRACVTFAWRIDLGAGGAGSAAFEIVETPNNSATILQEGKSRPTAQYKVASSLADFPFQVCGNFSFSSAGQKTLRLMNEQAMAGTVNGSYVLADGDTTVGQRDVHWEVYPVSQSSPMPVMVGPWAQTTSVKTSAYTILPSDEIVQADTTSGAFTVTLPSASTAGIGKVIRITKVNSGANLLTISGSIAGSNTTTVLHDKNETDTFMSDGSTWQWLSDKYRNETAYVANGTSSACTVNSQSGNWITSPGTRNATGDCTWQFPSGIFSATPVCTANGGNGSVRVPGFSTNSWRFAQYTPTGVAVDDYLFMQCRGLR